MMTTYSWHGCDEPDWENRSWPYRAGKWLSDVAWMLVEFEVAIAMSMGTTWRPRTDWLFSKVCAWLAGHGCFDRRLREPQGRTT